jgi:hypothetical protein
LIVMLSAHADVLGVGITPVVGSMLVSASTATGGWIVPGRGLLGTSGVESGKAAPLVGGPPGIVLHTVVDGLPSGGVGEMFPVVVMTIGEGMVPNVGGIIAVGDVIAVDAVMAVVPGMGVETVPNTVDDVGTGIGVMEGDGRGGSGGGCGAGMVVPA